MSQVLVTRSNWTNIETMCFFMKVVVVVVVVGRIQCSFFSFGSYQDPIFIGWVSVLLPQIPVLVLRTHFSVGNWPVFDSFCFIKSVKSDKLIRKPCLLLETEPPVDAPFLGFTQESRSRCWSRNTKGPKSWRCNGPCSRASSGERRGSMRWLGLQILPGMWSTWEVDMGLMWVKPW